MAAACCFGLVGFQEGVWLSAGPSHRTSQASKDRQTTTNIPEFPSQDVGSNDFLSLSLSQSRQAIALSTWPRSVLNRFLSFGVTGGSECRDSYK